MLLLRQKYPYRRNFQGALLATSQLNLLLKVRTILAMSGHKFLMFGHFIDASEISVPTHSFLKVRTILAMTERIKIHNYY